MSQKINPFPYELEVTRLLREQLNGHRAFTIWLTGLSGSGKTTLANGVDKWCYQNKMRSYVIDGDNTRSGINADLDFSEQGRSENLRRVAHICKLFNEAGVIAIAAFISPSARDRLQAREIIGSDSFSEVFIDASVATCMERDKKGLYQKAINGLISDFTGINSPFDIPLSPEVYINSNSCSIEASLSQVIDWLKADKI